MPAETRERVLLSSCGVCCWINAVNEPRSSIIMAEATMPMLTGSKPLSMARKVRGLGERDRPEQPTVDVGYLSHNGTNTPLDWFNTSNNAVSFVADDRTLTNVVEP
ncbi:hypothetical protein [Abyssibacter sp.]|uniref:hypothetical protein n=1 Tax=Abyssibacter sp. TaxID=2320200 RepID=UPI0035113155